MMVTILKGEQGTFIALSSHSTPPLIYFALGRPGQRDGWIHTHTHTLRDRQREKHYYTTYDIRYSRLYDIMGWVHRVVGTIWNVGAGDLGSLPVRNANSGKPLKVYPLTR